MTYILLRLASLKIGFLVKIYGKQNHRKEKLPEL